MVFDVTNPTAPSFVDYVNNRDPAVAPGLDNGSDYGPECLLFIEAQVTPQMARGEVRSLAHHGRSAPAENRARSLKTAGGRRV